MNEYNKYQITDDYSYFVPNNQIEFKTLSNLKFIPYFNREAEQIEVRIDNHNGSEKPSKEQIETINFVIENQNDIIHNTFHYYQNVILPIYKVAIDIDESEIAYSVNDLSVVLGIRAIEIPQLENINSIYYQIQFHFKYDEEHGLFILFDKTKPIDFFGMGDQSYDAIKLFENGLKNENGEPLDFNLYLLDGQTVFKKRCYFDEEIDFPISKGTYRTDIYVNRSQTCRNFYIPNDLTIFSMKEILTYK